MVVFARQNGTSGVDGRSCICVYVCVLGGGLGAIGLILSDVPFLSSISPSSVAAAGRIVESFFHSSVESQFPSASDRKHADLLRRGEERSFPQQPK